MRGWTRLRAAVAVPPPPSIEFASLVVVGAGVFVAWAPLGADWAQPSDPQPWILIGCALCLVGVGVYLRSKVARAAAILVASLVALGSGALAVLIATTLANGGFSGDIGPPELFIWLPFVALAAFLAVLWVLAARWPSDDLGGMQAGNLQASSPLAPSVEGRARGPGGQRIEGQPDGKRVPEGEATAGSGVYRWVVLIGLGAVALIVLYVQPPRPTYSPGVVGIVDKVTADPGGTTLTFRMAGRSVTVPARSDSFVDNVEPRVGDLLIAVDRGSGGWWIATASQNVNIGPPCYVLRSGLGTDAGAWIRWSSDIMIPKAADFDAWFHPKPGDKYFGPMQVCLNDRGEATSFQ